MIAYLQGRLSEKYPTHVVIECQGVGYEVHVSLHTYSQLGDQEQIKLLTHLHIKEDSHTLYGFCDDFERAIFRLLLSVSGIGTNTARTMLSSVSPGELKDAVIREDVRLIQGIKGIGAKTAQRIILDLKDKMFKLTGDSKTIASPHNTNKEEALSALEILGFSRKSAEPILEKIDQANPSLTVEDLIKMTLKQI